MEVAVVGIAVAEAVAVGIAEVDIVAVDSVVVRIAADRRDGVVQDSPYGTISS